MTQQDPERNDAPEQTAAPEAEPQDAAEAAEQQPAGDDRVAILAAEVERLKNEVLYARADGENMRRRLEQAAEDRGKYAVVNFAKDMLSVADNLRRALDAIPADARENDETTKSLADGVELTERELLSALDRYGVKAVQAQGSRFDPNVHQAMMEVEDPTQPSGTVVLVIQPGYTIHDRLLRPALVGVSKGGPKPGPADGSQVDTSV